MESKKRLRELNEEEDRYLDDLAMEVGYLAYAQSQRWWFEVMKWLPWSSCQRIDRGDSDESLSETNLDSACKVSRRAESVDGSVEGVRDHEREEVGPDSSNCRSLEKVGGCTVALWGLGSFENDSWRRWN